MGKAKTIVECPHCKKKVIWSESPWRPFCSERCRLIDLGDWASEKYKIAGEKVSSENLPDEESHPLQKKQSFQKKKK